ncbi:hypothetical protein OAO01_03875 [Oligoflexia bacterium]|nr:hypothetical protein [Oligoflexia bacterium]
MAVIEDLNSKIATVVGELWPEIDIEVGLRPQLDLSRGDLVTDVCLRLAAVLRMGQGAIASQLVSNLSSNLPCSVTYTEGFLNLTLPDKAEWLLSFVAPSVCPKSESLNCPQYIIILPQLNEQLCRGGYLRLCSIGVFQFLILKALNVNAKLYFGKDCVADSQAVTVAMDVYRAVIERCLSTTRDASKNYFKETLEVIQIPKQTKIFLWSYTNCGDTRWLTREQKHNGATERPVEIKALNRDALSGVEIERDLVLQDWSDRELLALLFYFSGGTKGHDLDFNVPRMEESDNLLWLVRTTAERVERFGQSAISFNFTDQIVALNSELALTGRVPRNLLLRLRFLSDWFCLAGTDGAVVDFTSVLQKLLVSFGRIFNLPDLRQRLEQGSATPLESAIISVLYKEVARLYKELSSIRA